MLRLERARPRLHTLRTAGCSIALDHFGTGPTSLANFRNLPIDAIKLDQSFLSGLGTDRHGTALVSAVAHLAHTSGQVIIADGVTDVSELAALLTLGCDQAQGDALTPARPPDALGEHPPGIS
jgi:EAL domain-containing protein (putative c-di-GMP-specific phosphodiesterase class I)